ncbi:MAG: pilus assembly FimT family protein [Candidatus Methylomirabilia bacterium]
MGFTLIEIVLVLVLLAVAGVIAVPAIQPALDSVRTEAAVRRTASFLDAARTIAVLERKVLIVHCRPDEGRLMLLGAAFGEGSFLILKRLGVVLRPQQGEVSPVMHEVSFPVPEAVAIVSCLPEEMRYFPQGSATGMTLLLRDAGGRERSLSVGAFTGLSRVGAAR